MKLANSINVTLRQREVSNGRIMLYLDIIAYGDRHKESLHMYLEPGKDRNTKKLNEQTMNIAQLKAVEMKNRLLTTEDGINRSNDGMDTRFYDYALKLIEEKTTKGTRGTWKSMLAQVFTYEKRKNISFRFVTKEWIKGFVEYLNDQDYSSNTKWLYYQKFVAVIHKALEDDIITRDPSRTVRGPRKEETDRNHLSKDELLKIYRLDGYEGIKEPFLFACMTGLRWSDVSSLMWSDINTTTDNWYIVKNQVKTQDKVVSPINELAKKMIGEPSTGKVFANMKSYFTVQRGVPEMCEAAGINKKITFHCSRHTFACLTLSTTNNIALTSRLLGHKDIKTTQIYAKVLEDDLITATKSIDIEI